MTFRKKRRSARKLCRGQRQAMCRKLMSKRQSKRRWVENDVLWFALRGQVKAPDKCEMVSCFRAVTGFSSRLRGRDVIGSVLS